MNAARFEKITERYAGLHMAVLGDFCLDRYLDIDPARQETSLETGLPVHNVVRVRSQPGGAGTILNNLAALGVGHLHAIGFAGEDGEGWELRRALEQLPGVGLDHFQISSGRRTFTYCKPLIIRPGQPPEELSRLDSKNWTPAPPKLEAKVIRSLQELTGRLDALILLEQVDQPETGVITRAVRQAVARLVRDHPRLVTLADSRRGLKGFPPMGYKMNLAELAALTDRAALPRLEEAREMAGALARRLGHQVFVTMAEQGLLGATAQGAVAHAPSWPVRGPIDIVGAGDAVTANLAASLAAGATLPESLQLASAAASIVIHQLGTTGSASVPEIQTLLQSSFDSISQ